MSNYDNFFQALNLEKYIDKFIKLYEIQTSNIYYQSLSKIFDMENYMLKHILDSLLPNNILQILQPKIVMDLGSGAGFPSIPLAVVNSNIQFFAVDGKEISKWHIHFVAKKAAIKNIFPVHSKIGHDKQSNFLKNKIDLIVSRAFGQITKIIKLTSPFLTQNGKILLYKGAKDKCNEEIKLFSSTKYAKIFKLRLLENEIKAFPFERNFILLEK